MFPRMGKRKQSQAIGTCPPPALSLALDPDAVKEYTSGEKLLE
jgi:hypothetical protein